MMTDIIKRLIIVVHPIVLIMVTKLDTQHLMLLLKWFVSIEATPLPYCLHKAIHPLTHGLLLDNPFTPTGLLPEICKTKKVNRSVTL